MSRVIIMTYMANNVKRLIYGVGINNLPYPIKKCPYYERWRSILCRCYSKKFHKNNPSYIGCEICEDWKYAINFKIWMETQDWKGKVLDKDILFPKNKIYSPETCIFVPIEINSLLSNKGKIREYPLGVYKSKTSIKYNSFISINGKRISLGLFSNKITAHREWQKHRFMYIKEVATKQDNILLKKRLLEFSKIIENDYNNFIETKPC